ncbi:MAG TPA: 2'-5' RNA ligase family protein [Bacillota bacterium]|nr:2'-5' RNA ligase family protein [Bacillota bacterium]
MNQTVVSPQIFSEDEHNIAAFFTQQSLAQIVRLQTQLQQQLGDVIWLTPPHAAHITLMEIIRDTEYKTLSRKQHFTKWYERYNQITKDTIAGFGPVCFTFNQLQVSPNAIIIKAKDPAPFNDIRAALLAKIVLPEGTKQPPDIVHCTLARFAKAIDLDEATAALKTLAVNFEECITEFRLEKDISPPNFRHTTVETYKLGQQAN